MQKASALANTLLCTRFQVNPIICLFTMGMMYEYVCCVCDHIVMWRHGDKIVFDFLTQIPSH